MPSTEKSKCGERMTLGEDESIFGFVEFEV